MDFLPYWTLADMLYAFRTSNFAGQVIVVVLFLGSIYAWSIMVTKYTELRKALESSQAFARSFRSESHPVSLFLRRQKYPESPLYKVYEQGCLAVGAELEPHRNQASELFLGGIPPEDRGLDLRQLEKVRNVTERTVADQALLLESKMGILATAVSASPFLGLLGTVWGVMDSFTGMAIAGSATLPSMAPGVAGALLTTVIGLLVALPSSIGYNMLANRIRRLHVLTDNFGQEFMAEIQKTFIPLGK